MTDTATVAGLLRSHRPGLEIRSLDYLAAGDFCHAFLLNGAFIVRVPRHAAADRALEREACLMPALAPRLPVPVPVPEYVRGAGAARSFGVHERIDGTVLSPTVWAGLAEPARSELGRGVGRVLAALHAIDPAVAWFCEVEHADAAGRAEALRRSLRDGPGRGLPEPVREALDRRLAGYLAGGERWAYDPAILHGDVAPGHVLVDAERAEITGVIDWGDAVIGDPARDFIFLYEDWGRDFLELALDGYELEPASRLRPRVYMQYLIDQLDWTIRAAERGRVVDVEHGIAALRRAVRDAAEADR